MSAQAATQILAKGPLSTALGQWIFLGMGTFVIFTGDNGVSKAAQDIASVAFRLVTGRDGLLPSGATLFREAALGGNNSAGQQQVPQPQQPIIIHSVSSSDGSKSGAWGGGWTTTIIQLGLASGACWTAYIIFTNFLPEQVKEMLPVTRKFFESAVTSLGQGILRVRDALGEQIAALGLKQEELSNKQDETHDQVLGLKDDIGDVRLQVDDIAVAISRCEGSLSDAAGRQTYMSRGVRLLVQCVGDLLRPSNPTVAEELDQFSRLSAELMDDEFHYKDGSRRGGNTKGLVGGSRQQLEYPSSPNLSEIGSTTSTVVDHENHNMRTLSLPRPRRSQSSSSSTREAPNSTSKVMSMSMGGLTMLQSLSRGNSSVGHASGTSTPITKQLSRQYSSQENEVPQSNYHERSTSGPSSGQVTPYGSDTTDPVKLEEVDELLRIVRNGGNPLRV